MSYWRDPDFQSNLIAFLCRDRSFLKKTSGLLDANDFKPRKDETQERFILAKLALNFWREYDEPIGGLLRTEVLDYCREKENRVGTKLKEKLLDEVESIRSNHSMVAVEALEQKVIAYKARRAKQQAIDELIQLQEKGKLSDERFLTICQDALQTFGHNYKVVDYMKGVEQRIRRRQIEAQRKFPYLMIEPLDVEVRAIPRGSVGLLLAKWKTGKSIGLTWIAYAMALQSYNVLLFTLEDPKNEVEDRLDGLLTALPVRQLVNLPNKLRKRFKRAKELLQGRIKIVDGTEGGMTVQRMEDIWEKERNRGFIADVVIVDYDDEIVPVNLYKGDAARRMQFADIYRDLRKFAARRDIYLWTAAQARRGKESQMVVSGEDAAEDISKIRKVAMCIGIGAGPQDWKENGRHLHVAAHKYDRQKIGWSIMGDFNRGIFYDQAMTARMLKKEERKRKQEEE